GVESEPPAAVGNGYPHGAELSEAPHDLGGEGTGAIALRRSRHDLVAAEVADHLSHRPLRVVQRIGHGQSPNSRIGRRSPFSVATRSASGYPASAWRTTPLPGSLVSTLSSF